jgi:lipid II isoglutaminyl synthase (glutamine-hydrolysing)
LSVAVLAGKLTGNATRLLKRGGGTAAPGLVAERVDPQILAKLTKSLPRGAVMISGTNGKTTTSRILGNILHGAGIEAIHNRSGSNLTRGLVSTLLDRKRKGVHLGLFEVDEAALTKAAELIKPRVLVLNNLFRDQLDRYFELDQLLIRWKNVIKSLPPETIICLNADDPRLVTLGHYAKGRVLYFGVASSHEKLKELPQSADILSCPNCDTTLSYDELYLGHQGRFFCSSCQFRRPNLDISAGDIKLEGLKGASFDLKTPLGESKARLGVPGFYNVYNALAAAAGSVALGLEQDKVISGLAEFKAAFGRIERIPVDGKEILITLVKNPTGFNEVLRLLQGTKNEHLLIILNDLFADGRDVSWIWDVDMEKLIEQGIPIVASGIRAWDLAVRLKYAGVKSPILVEENSDKALKLALGQTPIGRTLFVLPTYTAMLGMRQYLTKLGHAGRYWED